MTDIPVGSPPAPPGRHAAPGGWYADPLDQRKERYWDGWQWSKNTRDAAGDAGATPSQASSGQGNPGQGASQAPGGLYGNRYTPRQFPPQYGNQYPQGQYPQGQPGPDQGQHGSSQQGPSQYGGAPQQPNQYGGAPQQPNPYGGAPQQPNPYEAGAYPPAPGPYQPQPPYGQFPGAYPPAQYPLNVPGRQAVATADGVRLAGWWWRALAVLVDWLIVAAIAAVPSFGAYSRIYDQVSAFFQESMRAAQAGEPAPTVPSGAVLVSASDQIFLALVFLTVAFVYNAAFLRWKAATPGKLLCRLRVVPVDQGQFAGQLSWRTVLIRVAIWVLPRVQGLLLIVRVVDVLFPLWQPKRQALHDLAAKTQVVKLS